MGAAAKTVVAVCVSLATVAGCSGDDDSSDPTADASTTVETTASSTEATTTTEPAPTTTAPPTTVDPSAAALCEDADGARVVEEGARRGEGEERESCLDGEWVADPVLDTETTLPTDDELVAATIRSGTHAVPDDIPFGLYRVSGAWALLDERGELIAGDAVDPIQVGLSLMSVGFGVPLVEIEGDAVQVEFVPVFDPLAEGATQGTYLVGTDLAPGTYRVSSADGASAARLGLGESGEWEVLGEESGPDTVTITVEPADFAFRFSGAIERL